MTLKRPDTFTLIIIASATGIIVIAGFLVKTLLDRKIISLPTLPAIRTSTYKASGRPSANILALTSPVTSITGTVERINKNRVEIKIPVQPTFLPPAPGGPAAPQPTAAELSYVYLGINLSDNTTITKNEVPIPYLLKQTSAVIPAVTATTLQLSDIKTGDTITISTDSDLRLDKTANANSIFVLPRPHSLYGIIKKVEGSSITVRGTVSSISPIPALAGTAETRDYLVRVTGDTEISAYPPLSATPGAAATSPKPLSLSVSDLKEGLPITVYTSVDVSATTEFDALLISPSFPPETPPTAGPATAPVQQPAQ